MGAENNVSRESQMGQKVCTITIYIPNKTEESVCARLRLILLYSQIYTPDVSKEIWHVLFETFFFLQHIFLFNKLYFLFQHNNLHQTSLYIWKSEWRYSVFISRQKEISANSSRKTKIDKKKNANRLIRLQVSSYSRRLFAPTDVKSRKIKKRPNEQKRILELRLIDFCAAAVYSISVALFKSVSLVSPLFKRKKRERENIKKHAIRRISNRVKREPGAAAQAILLFIGKWWRTYTANLEIVSVWTVAIARGEMHFVALREGGGGYFAG